LWMTAVVASSLQIGRFEALWRASGYVGDWLFSFFTFLACRAMSRSTVATSLSSGASLSRYRGRTLRRG
jgi:hypothetical protein